MHDRENRQAYMVASVEQDIAWQVRINRERRGWTQTQLAQKIGTKQSAIARIEDPTYGKVSLVTLTKLADVFDCALMLRLVDFEKFANETEDLREDSLFVQPCKDAHGP
jgi:ribosome-binding protein aMBF1 (putative translation factor)